MQNYGQKIAQLRREHNLTQAELGEKLNVSAQAVSKWENSQSEPDLDTVRKICELFEIDLNDFFCGDVKPKNATAQPQVERPIGDENKTVDTTKTEGEIDGQTQSEQPQVDSDESTATTSEPSETPIVLYYCDGCSEPIHKGDKCATKYDHSGKPLHYCDVCAHGKGFTTENATTQQNETKAVTTATSTQPQVSKKVVYRCDKCSEPIHVGDMYGEHTTYHGRGHVADHTYFCQKCATNKELTLKRARDPEEVKAEKIKAEKAENKVQLRRGLIWGVIAAIVVALINFVWIKSRLDVSIFLTVICITLIPQLFWDAWIIDCLLFFMRSFKMPGIIFSLSWDGIKFLILAKIGFAILSCVLSVLVFFVGIVITGFLSMVTFIPALVKQTRAST